MIRYVSVKCHWWNTLEPSLPLIWGASPFFSHQTNALVKRNFICITFETEDLNKLINSVYSIRTCNVLKYKELYPIYIIRLYANLFFVGTFVLHIKSYITSFIWSLKKIEQTSFKYNAYRQSAEIFQGQTNQ